MLETVKITEGNVKYHYIDIEPETKTSTVRPTDKTFYQSELYKDISRNLDDRAESFIARRWQHINSRT